MTSERRRRAFTLVLVVLGPLAAAPRLAVAQVPDQASSRRLLGARLAQTFQRVDIDGDGLDDVVVADFLANEVRVIANRGRGELGTTTRLTSGRGPRAVVAADFNQDGWPDLAVSNFFSGDVAVYFGEGGAQFSAPRHVNVGVGANALAGADFTGDGHLDLVVANVLSGDVVLLRGEGGLFEHTEVVGQAPATSAFLVQERSDGSSDLLAVDLNGERARRFIATAQGLSGAGDEAVVFAQLGDRNQTGPVEAVSTDGSLLRRVSGDGQAARIGGAPPEPFVVEIRVSDGTGWPGQTVLFADLSHDFGQSGVVSLLTDQEGRTGVALGLGALPQNRIVAALSGSGDLEVFSATSTMQLTDLLALARLALANSFLDVGAQAVHQALLADLGRHLSEGGVVAAAATLTQSLALLDETPSRPVSGLVDVLRRFTNQLLTAGRDVEPFSELTCGVPVSGSIDAASEVDTFTFNVTDGERVEIAAVKTGGHGSFSPVWRLLDDAGAQVIGCGTNSSSARDCGPLPASGNPYAIQVVDANLSFMGTYNVNLERLTASARCPNATMTCGTAQPGNLEAAADTDLFDFSVAAGERVEIAAIKTGGLASFSPVWRLLDGAGVPVTGCASYSSSARDCGPLPTSGNPYAVEVVDANRFYTGTYNVNVERLTGSARCPNATMTCGTAQPGNLEAVADSDLYAFNVAAAERVEIAAIKTGGAASFSPVWRLVDGVGAPVAGCGSYSSSARDCGPLPTSGNPYALEVVDANRFYTGTYNVNIERLTSGARCPNGSLTCGVPVPGEIELSSDTDVFDFAPGGDGTVRVAVTKTSGQPFFSPIWRLLDATGAPAGACGSFSSATRMCSVTAAASPYALEVMDSNRFYTGTYTVLIDQCNITTPGPDLVVTAVTNPPATAVLGSKITVTDTTNNQGGAATVATKNRYYFSSDQIKSANDKRLGGARNVPGLGAGASHAGSKAVTVPKSMRTGVYFLLACADDTKLVNEGTNENNNCLASATTIEIKAPDLVVSALSNPPAGASPGGSFAATDTVHNGGNAEAASSMNGYFLSLDTKKSGSDIALTGSRAVGALNIGGNSTGNATVTVPPSTPSNSYYLIACADVANKVAEGNVSNTGEKNNCRASATKVTISP